MKAYIATPRWSARLREGVKIVLADSPAEAGQILKTWTERCLQREQQKYPGLTLEWEIIIEKPL